MSLRSLALPLACAVLVAWTSGCERPPVGPPTGDPPPAGRVGPLALEIFTQDRPAIAGKWFDYNPDGHTLSAKPQAWIIRDGTGADARYIALRIVDIYESDAAESGRFTFGLSAFDDVTFTWGAESEWVTPRNVKLTGQMCVDLFARAELPCDDDGAWQLRLAIFTYFSPLAGIAVADPGLFVHDGTTGGQAKIARVDDVADLAELADAVLDPAELPELDDTPSSAWDSTDWRFDTFAPDLPLAGMAVGPRFVDAGHVGRDDVYWLITARFDLVRFTVRPTVDGDPSSPLRFSYAGVEADREDWTAPDKMPEPASVDVAVPAPGEGTWLTFDPNSAAPGGLDLAAEHLDGTKWPHAPPKSNRFDVAVARTSEGDVHLLVSPGCALLNATQLGLDENVPPVSTP